ncbi:TonB-linked outer membrane protein, SusC/RagA family [Flagellimonas taeanensis]|uniref:TonB-linked outer membrane protein, SusC/RagA family n=1 Tax=Flagellimonas taeanensis TaxID=1005926 RepID=A0A1M6P625_9FLAO|nr:TonB-dependent receptor [Allomuricauda taeanensis]SFB66357.1 TonB-linked outer membrane protein, SusC/RagA family [Allomuricauda taeanensis]SHK03385.1 TonB-linked outer membrane protein, SusC/RagA family [Allomuricauda taeanensis]
MRYGIVKLLVLLCTAYGFSQTKTITGTVSDNTGPMPGVNVLIKGTTNGVVTDFDGMFNIDDVSNSDVLVFSYIGFVTQEIPVGAQDVINIVLQEDTQALDEVIVVGYGTQKKSNVIGSVTSVEIEEATNVPTTNVSEMLRGRAAGVQVNLGDARPGGGSNIVIRGNVSVAPNGNSPLIIVDGLPFDNLNDVAPDDIANIEILKDASSTAIYGSRASNGVILVTTKTGRTGKATIDYHGYTTIQTLTKNFNQYDGQQFIDLRREANRNRFTGAYLNDENIFSPFELEAIENRNFVDWEDLVLRDAVIQSHSLSFSSGTEKTKIFSSVNYFTQEGIIPNSSFDRGTFKLNIEQQLTDKLVFRGIINYQNANQDRETGGLNFTTITPLAKPFDEEGELVKFYLGPSNTAVNPLWDQRESTDETKINLTDINLSLVYNFTPNLSYTLKTFLRNRNTNRGIYRSTLHSAGDEGIDGIAVLSNTLFKQVLVENILNYTPQIHEDHTLDFTAVQAFDEQRNEYTQIDKSGFTNDALGYNGNATTLLNNPRDVSQRRLLSFLGRVRYGYLDRYLLEATARADGASVFAENNKWGFFPAVSVAWKMQNEPFLQSVEAINELKLRVSYGATGNQGINPLESLGVADDLPYVFGDQTVGGATASSRLPNPNLKWETTTTLNTGVDFRLFNNLFEGTFEYYKANTTDLLLDRSIAGTTGFNVIRFNAGELQNQGIEASLTTNIFRKENFRWSLGLIFSRNRNEVISLTGELDDEGNPIDLTDTSGRRLSVGQSINNIWLPKYDGIYQVGDDIAGSGNPLAQPGDVRVVDQDGNGQIDDRDNVFTNTDPDWYGSITNTISYKNFDLFADIYIVDGATRLNPVLANGELWKGAINGIRAKYYTPEYPSTEYPRPKPDTHLHLFSFAVRDASYVRLRTLTLGYNIPRETFSKIGLQSAKLYVTGTNLFTFTDFRSYSPEQNPVNGGETAFPETRNITLGVKLGF